jgi:nucleotide-binding universal stress UspA family protein
MSSLRKILFPVDLSESSQSVAPFVEAMVKTFQAQLTLLHVLETPPAYLTNWYGFRSTVDLAEIRNGRIGELDQFLPHLSGPSVSRTVVEGEPAQAITQYAQRNGFDLVAMPTHGLGTFREMLLGSVTAKVLHDCPVPVWTGIHAEPADVIADGFADIMCAVDLEERSTPTIQFANAIANDCGARLWLVHAIPGAETRSEKYLDNELIDFLQTEARRTLMDRLEAMSVKAAICIGVGDVAKVVRHSAVKHMASIVVAGRGHISRNARMAGRLRTHVYSIIRESPCPVISV